MSDKGVLPTVLPSGARDVLALPEQTVPDVVRALISRRRLHRLVRAVNADLGAADPELRRQAKLALRHLGFVD